MICERIDTENMKGKESFKVKPYNNPVYPQEQ